MVEVIADLRPKGQVASAIPIQVHQPILEIVGHLLVEVTISADRETLGNVLHSSVFPHKLAAGAIMRGVVSIVGYVLELRAHFRFPMMRHVGKRGRRRRREIVLANIHQGGLIVREAGRK